MSSAPQTTDQLAALINIILNGLTTGVAAPAIETTAEAEAPVLAAPVIKQIFEDVINYLAGKLSIAEQTGALEIVFSVQEDSRLYALGKALLALQAAQKQGDPNAISSATNAAVNQWGSIIHWPGLAPVSS